MSGSFMSRAVFSWLGLVLACGGDIALPGGPGEPTAPEPASLRIVSGDDQRAEPGTLLDIPLRVQVLDGSGQPMGEVTIQFSFLDQLPDAGLLPSSSSTDQEGYATAFARLGSVPGKQLIGARVAGAESPDLTVEFRAIAAADDGRGKRGGGDDNGRGDDDDGEGDDDRGGGGPDDDDDEEDD